MFQIRYLWHNRILILNLARLEFILNKVLVNFYFELWYLCKQLCFYLFLNQRLNQFFKIITYFGLNGSLNQILYFIISLDSAIEEIRFKKLLHLFGNLVDQFRLIHRIILRLRVLMLAYIPIWANWVFKLTLLVKTLLKRILAHYKLILNYYNLLSFQTD